MLKWTIFALVLGFFIDLIVGDPPFLYHPVRIIGNGIALTEKGLRRIFPKTPEGERAGGFFLILIICLFSAGIPGLILWFAYHWRTWLGVLLETFMCYQLLAAKSLKAESMKVYEQLKAGNLEGARYAVSMIVGRDTKSLDEEGVTKAAVETIAENTSDGVIAPLFYMALGGAPLMFLYKAINTMDSMVGYKNDKYLNFGRLPAKLDDAANFVPARISAWLMVAASFFLKMDSRNAARIYRRDRRNHASPNSAQTEAVMAGALGVQLAGDAYYFGKLYQKPTIGDRIRKIQYEDIRYANNLLYASAGIGVLFFGLIRLMLQIALQIV